METTLLFALIAGCLIGLPFGVIIGCVIMHDVDEDRHQDDTMTGGG